MTSLQESNNFTKAVLVLFVVLFTCLLAQIGNANIEQYYQVNYNNSQSGFLTDDLYVATKDLPDNCRDYMYSLGIDVDALGCPMPVFTYEGSGNESNSGGIFWIPVVSRNVIQGFYVISTGRLSVGYTTSLSGKIQALAKKTSEKNPLYLIADNIYTYAIIGDTAYYIGDSIIENEIDYLPKIVIRESDKIGIGVISGTVQGDY